MDEEPELLSDNDDLPDMFIPPEVDMVVDDTPIVLPDDPDDPVPVEPTEPNYAELMLKDGLTVSDIEYFQRAYRNLEDVKHIRIHCTSCDKHLGSAPKNFPDRYAHPLLNVTICERCYVFYSSGDFEKDEDGSELYCRWCGEGGQVFCCTKCPFVFCKRCIVRNLGRGISSLIQNSDDWMCFSCNPSQISRHRATFWAVQKYSQEVLSQGANQSELNYDANICCSTPKKRPDSSAKQKGPSAKRPKSVTHQLLKSALQTYMPKSTPTSTKNIYNWQLDTATEPEAEVVCTPDIIPIDDSPPSSPKTSPSSSKPPPLLPKPPPLTYHYTPSTPISYRPQASPSQLTFQGDFHNHLQTSFSQKIKNLTPQQSPFASNPVVIRAGTSTPINSVGGNIVTMNDKKYKLILSSTNQATGQKKYLLTTSVPPSTVTQNSHNTQNHNTQNRQNAVQSTSNSSPIVSSNVEKPGSWFDDAVLNCAEVTEYISTKIASLSNAHKDTCKPNKLMEDLHNTFQTYLQCAIEKLSKIKTAMNASFESEKINSQKVNSVKVKPKKRRVVNPFAVSKAYKSNESTSNSSEEYVISDDTDEESSDESDNDTPRKRKNNRKTASLKTVNETNPIKDSKIDLDKKKNTLIKTEYMKPEEVLFDMDVTNASDEEVHDSPCPTPMDTELIKHEIIPKYEVVEVDTDKEEQPKQDSVINILDTSEENIDNANVDKYKKDGIADEKNEESRNDKDTDNNVIEDKKREDAIKNDDIIGQQVKESVTALESTEESTKKDEVNLAKSDVDKMDVSVENKSKENIDKDKEIVDKHDLSDNPTLADFNTQNNKAETNGNTKLNIKTVSRELIKHLSAIVKIENSKEVQQHFIDAVGSNVVKKRSENVHSIVSRKIDEFLSSRTCIDKSISVLSKTLPLQQKFKVTSENSTKPSKTTIDNKSSDVITDKMSDDEGESNVQIDSKPIEIYDIEEMLSGSIVQCVNKKEVNNSFGDAFSKFIDNTEPTEILSDFDENTSDSFTNQNKDIDTSDSTTQNKDIDTSDSPTQNKDIDTSDSTTQNKDIGTSDSTTQNKDIGTSDSTIQNKDIDTSDSTTQNKDIDTSDSTTQKKDMDTSDATTQNKDIDLSDALINQIPTSDSLASQYQNMNIDIDKELDMIPSHLDRIKNLDNSSLSLPPDDFPLEEFEVKLGNKSDNTVSHVSDSDISVDKKLNEIKETSDIEMDSEILALKQMAENCMTSSVDLHKTSTECQG